MQFFLKGFLSFFIVIVFPTIQLAQKNGYGDITKLAMQYYEQKEYEKANLYLEELYENVNANIWYPYYFRSLMATKNFSDAEKITKRQLKQNKNNVFLYVYLGRIYKANNQEKKEKEAYSKALKELIGVQPFVQNLAEAFLEDKLYDYAIETYNQGRKTTPEYPYFYERADIYKARGDLKSMINEYLDALEFRDSEIQTVQMNLQNSLGYDDEQGGINNPLLKTELQKRIQKDPDKIILSEFLIFIQKQQQDFEGAFVQSRALDKRLKEEGQRVYDLAKICVSNKQWSTAKRCYEYIIEKGADNLYYDAAILDNLNVTFLSVTLEPQPTKDALLLLEQQLIKANEKYKNTLLNGQIIKNLATLQAYYLNKSDAAIKLLSDYITQPGIEPAGRSDVSGAISIPEFKLMLGDIYLLNDEIWDASLLYSQVEKEYKYEAIGQEAKFRNAKLSFYAGDFAWAKTQADVLKGATSKLIANDALDLSLIITDAIGVDTNEVPLKLFSSADLMVLQHRYTAAIARMDSINLLFSNNTLGDDIYYKKAQIYFKLGKYNDAEAMYKNILEYYPSDIYADDAQIKLAELYETQLNDKEKAKQAYQDVLTKFPGSIFTVEARKRYRELRGDNISN